MKKLITENDIASLLAKGTKVLFVDGSEIITPAAKDKISYSKIEVITKHLLPQNKVRIDSEKFKNKIAIGSDHTGFEMKSIVAKYLGEKSIEVFDVGTFSKESCDYPDYAFEVSKKVINGEVEFGIVLDATGIPSAITANKIPGIRAATCYNEFSAKSAREHNNGNVLVLGAKTLGEETIKSIIDKWLSTDFAGGRHQKRLDKIDNIEKSFRIKK